MDQQPPPTTLRKGIYSLMMPPPPSLVTNSIYSLANLHSSLDTAPPPMSAPPLVSYTPSFGFGGSMGLMSSNNSGMMKGGGNRDAAAANRQIFFGSDFNSSSPSFQPSSHNLLFDNSVGDGGGGYSGGGGDGVNRSDSSANSLSELIRDHFDALMNLRSPQQVPLSAPPFHSHSGGPMNNSNDALFGAGVGRHRNRFNNNNNIAAAAGRHYHNRHKTNQPVFFSLKIFLGGLPANLTTNVLQLNFAKFGNNFIDWPKKMQIQDRPPNGYAFVVYDEEQSIIQMLQHCKSTNNRVFFPIRTLEGDVHQIEVKVWEMKDTLYANMLGWRQFRSYSVFVGGIPRTCTAMILTMAVEEVIGPVAYCAIELDQHHFYPKGAACVVFTSKESYIKAIAAHEVLLSFGTFERKVEFKAFLASNMPCEKCGMIKGTNFCEEMLCLAYYCPNCWKLVHNARPSMAKHQPSKRHVVKDGERRPADSHSSSGGEHK